MEDIALIVIVAVFMIFGYFVMGAVDRFLTKNYKGFEDDNDETDTK